MLNPCNVLKATSLLHGAASIPRCKAAWWHLRDKHSTGSGPGMATCQGGSLTMDRISSQESPPATTSLGEKGIQCR